MTEKKIGLGRAVIYLKDVMRITGKKRTAARDLYNAIKAAFQKQPGQFLTAREFSLYTGIEMETIARYL